jgi:predicted glycoside hydrolase/deacetylase ChbG (UPF0249 family)
MNSHEHVHMLPRLWRLAARLATDYDIPLIRRTGPEWTEPWQPSSVLRNAALALMAIGSEPGRTRLPVLRGVSCSGRLDVPYLRDMLRRAEPGAAYELMCHPGFPDPEALSDPSLAGYHRWQQEVDVLCSSTFRDLLRDFRIRLIRFRDLSGTGP